jgi:hypothetical protein
MTLTAKSQRPRQRRRSRPTPAKRHERGRTFSATRAIAPEVASDRSRCAVKTSTQVTHPCPYVRPPQAANAHGRRAGSKRQRPSRQTTPPGLIVAVNGTGRDNSGARAPTALAAHLPWPRTRIRPHRHLMTEFTPCPFATDRRGRVARRLCRSLLCKAVWSTTCRVVRDERRGSEPRCLGLAERALWRFLNALHTGPFRAILFRWCGLRGECCCGATIGTPVGRAGTCEKDGGSSITVLRDRLPDSRDASDRHAVGATEVERRSNGWLGAGEGRSAIGAGTRRWRRRRWR